MKRKPIDPYFYEVVGQTLQFEGTLYSMTPVMKATSRKKHAKCFPTICFHNVKELNSKISFRQHVNVIVTEAMFNRILLDNRFFIGDTIHSESIILWIEQNQQKIQLSWTVYRTPRHRKHGVSTRKQKTK